jgi:hypothetical protein
MESMESMESMEVLCATVFSSVAGECHVLFSRGGPSARPHRLPSQLAQDLNQHWAPARTRCTTPLLVPQLIPWLAADAAAFLISH